MAVGLALAAATGAVRLARETETSGLFLWGAGSLLQTGWGPVRAGGADRRCPRCSACSRSSRSLDVAVLGESTARALGLRSGLTQIAGVTLAAVLTAVAVGLVRADRVRRHPRRRARPRRPGRAGHAAMLAVALPWGAAILLAADVAGRAITGLDTETPAGVVCALIGAPVLIVVARRLRGEGGPAIDSARERRALAPAGGDRRGRAPAGRGRRQPLPGRDRDRPGRGPAARSSAPARRWARSRWTRARRGSASRCSAAPAWPRPARCCRPRSATRSPARSWRESSAARRSAPSLVLLVFPDAPSLVAAVRGLRGRADRDGRRARAGGRRARPPRLALVGLAVTAACAAVTMLMLLHAQPAAATAITWLTGSTYATGWSDLRLLAVPGDRAAPARPARRPPARRADARRRPRARARPAGRAGRARWAARRGRRAGRRGRRGLRRDRVRRPARAARRAAARGRQPPPRAADGDGARRAAARPGRYRRAHRARPDRDPVRPRRVPDRRAVPGGAAVAEPDRHEPARRAADASATASARCSSGVDVPLPARPDHGDRGRERVRQVHAAADLRPAAEADVRHDPARRRRDHARCPRARSRSGSGSCRSRRSRPRG